MPKGDDRDRPGSILYDNGVYVFYTQYLEESVDGGGSKRAGSRSKAGEE